MVIKFKFLWRVIELLCQSYEQFADIINKLPFHSLSFDEYFVKYCKKLKESYTRLLEIDQKKKREMTVSDFLESGISANWLENT